MENASGAPIANAVVTAVESRTGYKVQVRTDKAGRYVFPALLPGMYSVIVEARGFRPMTHTNILLGASTALVEHFVVQIGATNEAMEEASPNERLKTMESDDLGIVYRRELDILPQVDRNPLTLSIYQPGMQIDPGNTETSRLNGTQQGSNNVTLDGMDVNDPVDPRLALSMNSLNSDSISQFTVLTSTTQAEFGRNAGAQLVVSTQSGGSRWSGTVYEFFTSKDLNANDFFNNSANLEEPQFTQHRYGGSLGGPIVKDRTFVFANYQRRRTTQEVARNRLVLTPTAKTGVFQWTPPGTTTTNSYDIVQNDPRGLGIDPQIAAVLSQLPDPNNTTIGDGLNTEGFQFNNPANSVEDQATVRMDHSLSANHRLFVRGSWERASAVDAANGADSTYPGQPAGTSKQNFWGLAAGYEWTVSPRTINQLRAGYQSAKISLDRPARQAGPMFLANSWTDPLNSSFGQWRNSPVLEITDNLSQIRGRHSLKAGFTFRYTTQKSENDAGVFPDVTFTRDNGNLPPSSIGPSGRSILATDREKFENLYNDLLGRMDAVAQTFYGDLNVYLPAGTGRARNFTFMDYAAFLQDDWKVHDNFTVNFGIRYELNGVPSEKDGIQGALDKAGSVSTTANISDFVVQKGSALYNQDYINFAPRGGFAWAPRNNTKMILRGGYGMFFDRLVGTTTNFVDTYTPATASDVSIFPNLGGTDRRLSDGIPVPSAGTPVLQLPATRSTSLGIFRPDLRTPYVHHFSMILERKLFSETFVEAGYIGQRGKKLFSSLNYNQVKIQGSFLQAFNELQSFRTYGTPVPTTNPLVLMFGSPNAAIAAIGGTNLDQGAAGLGADNVDRNYFANYPAAGLSDFYLRNYTQYNQFDVGTNDGSSSYDALQVRVRRTKGSLKTAGTYTYAKSIDNVPSSGNNYTLPVDSFNLSGNRGPSDFDRHHLISGWAIYTLPIGKDKMFMSGIPGWANVILSNWQVGGITLWETGPRFSVISGRETYASGVSSLADYTGNRQIGEVTRTSNGVYWFTPAQANTFTFPAAGGVGNSGRNVFTGPSYLNIDLSLVKDLPLKGERRISLRGEVYNVANRAHFGIPDNNLSSPTFGKYTSTLGSPRVIQVGLRFSF